MLKLLQHENLIFSLVKNKQIRKWTRKEIEWKHKIFKCQNISYETSDGAVGNGKIHVCNIFWWENKLLASKDCFNKERV